MKDEADAKQLIAFAQSLAGDRGVWDAHYQDVRDYIALYAGNFTGSNTPGVKDRGLVYDNSAESISEELTAWIHGALCPPGIRWHGLRAVESERMSDYPAQMWTEEVARRMFACYDSARSGFQIAIGESLRDNVDFGTAALYVEDRPGDLPRYCARPMSATYCAEGAYGELDTVASKYDLTASQAVERFGDKCPAKVLEAAADPAKSHVEKFVFWHLTFPRAAAPQRILSLPALSTAKNRPFASVWVCEKPEAVVASGGYYTRAMIVGRWARRTGEIYGRGCGMKALPDTKMLQRSVKATIKGAEHTADPALMLSDDGVVGGKKLNRRPSAINYMEPDAMNGPGDPVRQLPGGNPGIGHEFDESVRERMRNAYFLHLLRLPQEPRITLGHILELVEQRMTVMGPFLGRVQYEQLAPTAERTYDTLLRAGAFPPPPPALEGAELKVEYESPASKTQRIAEASAIVKLWESTRELRAERPDVLDNMDLDGQVRHVATQLGVPVQFLTPPNMMRQVRAARANANAEQVEIDQADTAAGAAQKLAQAAAAARGPQGGASGGQRAAA